jgi:hypothetical protein
MATVKPNLNRKQPCAVCMRIRKFLYVAVALLAVMWLKPEWRLPAGFNYSAIVGDLFLAAFVLVFAYKWWEHKRDVSKNGDSEEERFERLRQRTASIVADLESEPQQQVDAQPQPQPQPQSKLSEQTVSGHKAPEPPHA